MSNLETMKLSLNALDQARDLMFLQKECFAVSEKLRAKVPALAWWVKSDSTTMSFVIHAELVVSGEKLNSMYHLSLKQYQHDGWLENVAYTMVHGIAQLLIK